MYSTPRLRQNIYLIGDIETQIIGNKLPSKLQALKVLFFYLRELNQLSLRESATLVIDEVMLFWQKARLPTKQRIHSIEKLESLYRTWRSLQKNAGKEFNIKKEEAFTADLRNLFANVFDRIDAIQKEFLENQRKPERIGYISNIEPIYEEEERIQSERDQLRLLRLQKMEEKKTFLDAIVELASSEKGTVSLSQTSIGTYSNVSWDEEADQLIDEDLSQPGPSAPRKSRGTINIFDEKLVAVLDQCKITDRKAVHLIATVAKRLNYDVSTLILNKTSINRYRQLLREAKAKNIKKIFQEKELKASVLHWDGKLLYNLLKREVLDRLPIIITDGDTEHFLGIPELESGTGKAQAAGIFEVLEDWGLSGTIKAVCCDTTASNLGIHKGAAILLEQLLETDLLVFACRHHMYELVLRAAFDLKMPASSGPNVPMFKRFSESWGDIDKSKYRSGMETESVKKILSDHVQRIQSFVEKIKTLAQPRDDYEELLDLTLIFLGVVPSYEVKFRLPGPIHHARWMAKAIYVLKIYLFRDCFTLNETEKKGLRDVCIFIVLIYVHAWFTAPLAPQAPSHDLGFIKILDDFKKIDSEISQMTLKKFVGHLWYLSPEVVAMSFFDEDLPIELKRKMVIAVDQNESSDDEMRENCPKRLEINPKGVAYLFDKDLDYFITPQCLKFFKRFEIDPQFHKIDPLNWSQDETFLHGLNIVKKLKVVNDTAERGVRLIENYNGILTNKEPQKQFIVQIVAEYRKQFPDANKETVMRDFL